MLESPMSTEEQWLSRFKEVVQLEIDAANGHHRSGYRAAAAKLHKSEEYVYQLFNGKPEGRVKHPSATLMDRVEEVYGKASNPEGQAPHEHPKWPAQAKPAAAHEVNSNPLPYLAQPPQAGSPIAQAFLCIAQAVDALDETGRRQATSVLSNLVDDPASSDRLATLFQVIVQTGKRRAA